jgi:hypothetical protein
MLKPMTKTLTEEELKNVIAYADSLQQYDRRRQDQRLLEGIVKREVDKREVPLPLVYEIGQELDIPREYLEKAMTMLYPSREQMVEDIKRFESVPGTIEFVIEAYRQQLNEVLLLNRGIEEYKVSSSEASHYGNVDVKKLTKRTFWKWERTQKQRFAFLYFWGGNKQFITVDITVYNPLFLRLVGKELEMLSTAFPNCTITHKFYHHYDPRKS